VGRVRRCVESRVKLQAIHPYEREQSPHLGVHWGSRADQSPEVSESNMESKRSSAASAPVTERVVSSYTVFAAGRVRSTEYFNSIT
jgi:hypothetical protein